MNKDDNIHLSKEYKNFKNLKENANKRTGKVCFLFRHGNLGNFKS